MQSNFEKTPRIFAFPLSELARLSALVLAYGADLPLVPTKPDSPVIRCVAGGLDRAGSDDLRGLDFPTTANALPLADGRFAFSGCWSLALVDALQSGVVTGEELSISQFQSLRPKDEDS